MRVLHVLEALEGGTARHVADLVKAVKEVEHHVAVPVTRQFGLTDPAARPAMRDAGAVVHDVAMSRSRVSLSNLRAVGEVRRLAQRIDVGVIHGHSSIGGVVARLARAADRAVVYTPNAISTVPSALLVERLLRSRTDAVIAVSRSEAAQLLSLGLVTDRALHVVENAIDPHVPQLSRSDARRRLGVPSHCTVVGAISRLSAQKDPLTLAAALSIVVKRHPGAVGVIIGSGPLESRVREAIGEVAAGRLRLLVNVPHAVEVLPAFDVFAMASLFEGGPYAPLEAMRSGVSCVLTDVVGSRDLGEAGGAVLVPPRDPDALAEAILALCSDQSKRTALAQRGVQLVATRFNLARMGAETRAVYERLGSG